MIIGDSQHPQDDNSARSTNAEIGSPNAGSGDPTDGRKRFDWSTRYSKEAAKEICWESVYLLLILFISHILIFATWKGWVSSIFSVAPEHAITLNKYAYYVISGMLGGVVFGLKYLYRVVARGYWHQDRRVWRLLTPFIAMSVSLVVGAMMDAALIQTQRPVSGAAFVSIGFLAGYFADEAVGKMYEVATVIFGKSASPKSKDDK